MGEIFPQIVLLIVEILLVMILLQLQQIQKGFRLNYGLVGTKEIPDLGVTMIIEPRININIPSIPNLSINPNIVTPNVQFTIPDVSTITFTPTILPAINRDMFNPPALNEVASGFAQDMQEVHYI